MIRSRRFAPAVVGVLASSGTALAHEGHGTGPQQGWGPLALFVGGAAVLGASVYLDANGVVSRRAADAGVGLGLLGLVAAVPLYWL